MKKAKPANKEAEQVNTEPVKTYFVPSLQQSVEAHSAQEAVMNVKTKDEDAQ